MSSRPEESSTGKSNSEFDNKTNDSDRQLESLLRKKSTNANVPLSNRGSKALPRRKSMYDHVEIDFVKSGKKTYLFRLLVAGTHDEDPTDFMRFKRNMIEEINATCHDEMATGFFLAYPRQFIHVLEGSEDTLNKYLSRCTKVFENPQEKTSGGLPGQSQRSTVTSVGSEQLQAKTPRVRMLVLGYFAIQDRLLSRWLCTKFNPPRELGDVEGGFRKNLFELVRTTLILTIMMSKQPTMKNGEIEWPDQADGPKTKARREQDMQLMQYLPSQHVIMYVLKDKPRQIKLKTPSEFIRTYWDVPDLVLPSETVWPIPCRIAPYN